MAPLTQAPLPLPKPPFGKTFDYLPKEPLAADKQRVIQNTIFNSFKVRLPDDWDWAWEVAKGGGPYVGKFTARVKSWLWKANGIKATKEVLLALSTLGELVQRTYPRDHILHFDLTNKIDWAQGTFGDSYSCFLNTNKRGAESLVEGGGGAMRRWSIDDDGKKVGEGRCFFYPCAYGYLMSNPRDRQWSYKAIHQMAPAFAAWMGLPHFALYQKPIYNKPTDSNYYGGPFYTDYDQEFQYLIGLNAELLAAGLAQPKLYMHLPITKGDPPHEWYPAATAP